MGPNPYVKRWGNTWLESTALLVGFNMGRAHGLNPGLDSRVEPWVEPRRPIGRRAYADPCRSIQESWVTCRGSPVLVHLSWVTCPGSPVLGHLGSFLLSLLIILSLLYAHGPWAKRGHEAWRVSYTLLNDALEFALSVLAR